MEEENKTPKESSIVFKKSIEKREKENHKTSQVDEKNNILVDPLEADNRIEKGKIKRLEETQRRERRVEENLACCVKLIGVFTVVPFGFKYMIAVP